jgi:hypothetical protein
VQLLGEGTGHQLITSHGDHDSSKGCRHGHFSSDFTLPWELPRLGLCASAVFSSISCCSSLCFAIIVHRETDGVIIDNGHLTHIIITGFQKNNLYTLLASDNFLLASDDLQR